MDDKRVTLDQSGVCDNNRLRTAAEARGLFDGTSMVLIASVRQGKQRSAVGQNGPFHDARLGDRLDRERTASAMYLSWLMLMSFSPLGLAAGVIWNGRWGGR